MPARLALGLLVLAMLLAGCTSSSRRALPPAVAAGLPAADSLRHWDAARARAFARGDAAALRRLYVAGSRAGTADVRLLQDYRRRGLRVEGMQMQLLGVHVLRRDRDRLVLRVTDRLVGAVVVDGRTRIPLPRDAASTRTLDLRRSGPDAPWRLAAVRE